MSGPIVLFLCSANSARSIMAEAILRHLAGDRFDARSAGLEPSRVHPLALRVLEEDGIGTDGLHSKPSAALLGKISVADAIVVCERAHQRCPRMFPFALRTHYWPFDDPAAVEGDEHERLEAFRRVRDQIRVRLEEWLADQNR